MRAIFKFRIRLILSGIVLVALLIVARLYFVQVVHGDDYALKADRQFSASHGGLFDRGSIYFTRKDGALISAATLETGFLIAVNPNQIADPVHVYSVLSAIAPEAFDRGLFMAAAEKKAQVYVEVAHHLSQEEGQAIAAKKIPGITVLRERWRSYPGGPLAAQTVGIVSYGSGDTLKGQTGLEAYYDDGLSRSSATIYKNFFAELFSNVSDVLLSARAAHEANVVTTIEPSVETRLTDDLKKVQLQYHSKETGGIIMDPKTGAIYALGTLPSFDPNDLSDVRPSTLANPLVEHVYEFGSIMKPLTMAAGLDAGVITPKSTYNDTGCIHVDQSTICNYDLKARGITPMQQILSQSLNVGASWIAAQLGPELMRSYFTHLGFGVKTNIDLPFETHGLIGNLQSPRQVEYDTASFGQGIAMTPVEMIRALGTLANNGIAVSPHVTNMLALDSGVSRALPWGNTTQIFGTTSVQQVSQMLTAVVDDKLSNGKVKIVSMSVAAKTGTAQLTTPEGGYYKDRFFHSFFGYFPSYNPRFVILLYTNDPQGVQYASETLTNTFMDLVHFLIDYYDVPPDRAVAATKP